MINFENFAISGAGPIYMQIILFVKRGIAAGNVQDGDEMPSRRVLSALLGVNPNTVQKAYRMLEEEGIIESHSGAKSYVSLTPEKAANVRRDLLKADMGAFVDAMKQTGSTKDEALKLLSELWEREEE